MKTIMTHTWSLEFHLPLVPPSLPPIRLKGCQKKLFLKPFFLAECCQLALKRLFFHAKDQTFISASFPRLIAHKVSKTGLVIESSSLSLFVMTGASYHHAHLVIGAEQHENGLVHLGNHRIFQRHHSFFEDLGLECSIRSLTLDLAFWILEISYL